MREFRKLRKAKKLKKVNKARMVKMARILNFKNYRNFLKKSRKKWQEISNFLHAPVKASTESIMMLIPVLIIFSIAFQLIIVNFSSFKLSMTQQTQLNKSALYQNEIDQMTNSINLVGGGKIMIQQRSSKLPILQPLISRIWANSSTFVYDENS